MSSGAIERLLAAINTTPFEDADAWARIVGDLRLSPTARKQLPRDLRVLLGDNPRKFWTPGELARLKELYPERSTEDVAKMLACTVQSLYQAAQKLGLKKSRDFLSREVWPTFGRSPGFIAAQFPKGNAPANKGVKRPGWYAGRMRETQFKKGCRTGVAKENYKPVGTISRDSKGYLIVKVYDAEKPADRYGIGEGKSWEYLHRRVWIQHKGPIPPKNHVAFIDRNCENVRIDNLELVSFAKMGRRNVMWNSMPRELAEVIQLSAALKRKIRRLSGEEQNQ